MKKISPMVAIAAVVLTAVCSGVVGATAASNTTIYACVSKSGTISKVSLKSHSCPRGTAKLNWGTQGVAGLQGVQGVQGIQGLPGEQGAIGPQGPAGTDGGGVTVYSASEWGQVNHLKQWTDMDTDYRILTTNNTLPAGNYFVTANSSFRYGTGAAFCWIAVDSRGLWPGIEISADAMPMQSFGQNISISGVVAVPAGGSTLSFACYGDTNTVNFETRISALKIVSLNPTS